LGGVLMPASESSRRVVTLRITPNDEDRQEIARLMADKSFHSPLISVFHDGTLEFVFEEKR
jgi:predicted DNA-binding protein with PD1-like motif